MGRKLGDSPNLQLAFDSSEIKQQLFLRAKEAGYKNIKDFLQAIAHSALAASPVPKQLILVAPFIEQQCPFDLAYLKATGELENYAILYAEAVYRSGNEINTPEGEWYLECYCRDANSRSEIPELAHNRTFQLSRLQKAVVVGSEAKWRDEGLATIEIELDLHQRLAHNYRFQIGRDIEDKDQWLSSEIRRVVWRVSSYLWATRSILRYGSSCRVVAPDSLRSQLLQEIEQMRKFYCNTR